MNKYTLLIAAALAAPLLIIVGIAFSGPELESPSPAPAKPPAGVMSSAPGSLPPTTLPKKKRPIRTLDEAKARAQKELKRLENLTSEEWEAEQKRREAQRAKTY